MTSIRVTFRVRVPLEDTSNDHTVFIVGNCSDLGDWCPSQAIALVKQAQNVTSNNKETPSKESLSKLEAIWSTTVDFADNKNVIEYRYFVGESSNANGALSVHTFESNPNPRILNFEQLCPSPCKSERGNAQVIHLSEEQSKESTHPQCADNDNLGDVSVYGCYGDERCVARGWLTENQYEFRVRLRGGEAVRLYADDKSSDFPFYLDCLPLYVNKSLPSRPPTTTAQYTENVSPTQRAKIADKDFCAAISDASEIGKAEAFKNRANVGANQFGTLDENLNNRKLCDADAVMYSKLGGDEQRGRYHTLQDGGVCLGEDENLVFSVVTRRPRDLVLKIIVWKSGATKESQQCLGSALLCVPINNTLPDQPVFITSDDHTLQRDITSSSTRTLQRDIIGLLTCSVLCIAPASPIVLNNLTLRRGRYIPWITPTCTGSESRPLLIGHRGMGSSFSHGQINARARENTLASFVEASFHGVDMVEFDVALSKDAVPVIYHDFRTTVRTTRTDQDGNKSDYSLHIPVQDLTLDELATLDLCSIPESTYYATRGGAARAGHRPVRLSAGHGMERSGSDRVFPTLRECFASVEVTCGFNIEVKYPIQLSTTGRLEDDLVPSVGRNEYVDAILAVVFECMSSSDGSHGARHQRERQIVFSSFDPDVCILFRAKQHWFPVLFLTQGENKVYPPYIDPRTHSISAAIQFALTESLAGIDVFSRVLLHDLSAVKRAHDLGLLVYCWGEDNNDKDNIRRLREARVDGIILDRCDEFNDCF